MNRDSKTLVILTPGFAASEADTACLPMQQAFVRTLKENFPELNIIILSFQYPFFKKTYQWYGVTVISFGGKNKKGLSKLLLRPKIFSSLKKIQRTNNIIGLLSALGENRARLHELTEGSEIDEQLITFIRDAARIALAEKKSAFDKLALTHRMLAGLSETKALNAAELVLRPRLLERIVELRNGQPVDGHPLPSGSLLNSGLITNAHGESVIEHLVSEFPTANSVDLLSSFIKLSGLDRLRRLVAEHKANGRRFRVLTTTCMRATDARAIEELHRLGAEVRISYDDSHTRLHAAAAGQSVLKIIHQLRLFTQRPTRGKGELVKIHLNR